MFPYILVHGVQAKSPVGSVKSSFTLVSFPPLAFYRFGRPTESFWLRVESSSFAVKLTGSLNPTVSPYVNKTKRETSARSLDEEVESYDGEEEEVEGEDKGDEGGEEGEDDGDEGEVDGRTSEGGSLGSLGDGHTCPFILPKMWTINDFKPMMSAKVFKNLRDCFQILDHIPIRLSGKFEKCYFGKTTDIGMYDAMFATGLSVRPHIIDKQEAFIRQVIEIPLDKRKCRDLITLDTLHAYCSGPEPTPIARRLNNEYSCCPPKVVGKGVPKRKTEGKDDYPSKKPSVTLGEKQSKKSSPPKSSHGTGKGLMTSSGPEPREPVAFLRTKDMSSRWLNQSLRRRTWILVLSRKQRTWERRALVRIKALQDRCVTKKGVISCLRKSNKTLSNEQDQYKDALRTFNKEVKSVYPHLDLSMISMDDLMPSTPAGDSIFKETDDSTQPEWDPKNNGVVLVQPAVEKPVTPVISSTAAQVAENPPTQDVQDLPKDDGNPLAPDA
uniref:Uncharacterized protein n=1 Tax=Quercus lobata TaxID=97700 RepID=A0A7N2MDM9_QUELO